MRRHMATRSPAEQRADELAGLEDKVRKTGRMRERTDGSDYSKLIGGMTVGLLNGSTSISCGTNPVSPNLCLTAIAGQTEALIRTAFLETMRSPETKNCGHSQPTNACPAESQVC